ncbi:hypothetical protein [Cognatishimia sp. F0-27]|uniref:hypothetical protein n=1 Tax=Cognatishimia sp. F0-27 TaxID=2816855 RepID=UPI001D0C678F|nr:hypothetical protein [Cognatishimia sp. F0-27]MCC1491646.1 hypothetical protein [Cognatishimia sp. F0-27]
MRLVLMTSAMTGLFCAGFAAFVDVVTEALSMGTLIALAFVSGFLGSLFAQVVLGRRR